MRQYWEKGVDLELGLGRYRNVTSTEDALACLHDRWQVSDGSAFMRAQRACMDALKGRVEARKARDAFIAAAEEADMFIRSK
jgi:hypothetical protein